MMTNRYRIEYDTDGNERIVELPDRYCKSCGWFSNDICYKEAERIKKSVTSVACGDYDENAVIADWQPAPQEVLDIFEDTTDETSDNNGDDVVPESSDGEDSESGADTTGMGGGDQSSEPVPVR